MKILVRTLDRKTINVETEKNTTWKQVLTKVNSGDDLILNGKLLNLDEKVSKSKLKDTDIVYSVLHLSDNIGCH